ncbi:MAG TPA: hypothetical protein VM734_14765 [Kofleriaceae bacterium]|jgi:hypothetical protein|nr:hypothetical protein [Kofleriaceae bacterium]
MRHGGAAWVSLGAIELDRGWRPELDRVRVEMYAESSADEGRAERLGREWLDALTRDQPELAGLVVVVGASH